MFIISKEIILSKIFVKIGSNIMPTIIVAITNIILKNDFFIRKVLNKYY